MARHYLPFCSIVLVRLTAILTAAATTSMFPPGSGPHPPHGPVRLSLTNPC